MAGYSLAVVADAEAKENTRSQDEEDGTRKPTYFKSTKCADTRSGLGKQSKAHRTRIRNYSSMQEREAALDDDIIEGSRMVVVT